MHLEFSWACGDGTYIAQGVVGEADGFKQVREVYTRAGGSIGEGIYGVPQAELAAPAATDKRMPYTVQYRGQADQGLVSEPKVREKKKRAKVKDVSLACLFECIIIVRILFVLFVRFGM